MQPKPEKQASAQEVRQDKSLLDQLGTLAKQNKAAYENALDDFRSSYALQHTISFSDK
ncbi:hypothetical protein [Ensifer sp. LC163]|uniref:hypothetical protein n=1 Tax=Ensifer sp. LC163 TaxID=1120652 RepID=UPI00137481C2|nr:hypothetical protein [Ensifer sp. LC163]